MDMTRSHVVSVTVAGRALLSSSSVQNSMMFSVFALVCSDEAAVPLCLKDVWVSLVAIMTVTITVVMVVAVVL